MDWPRKRPLVPRLQLAIRTRLDMSPRMFPADGSVPSPDVEGNFIIGPTHTPALETIAHEGVPHGTIHTFTMNSSTAKSIRALRAIPGTFGTPERN